MAYSYVAYTGNGSTTQFAITFPYVSQAHIKVYVNYVDTAYTYADSTTVQVATAPTNGLRVEVRRVTPINSVLVNYTDGATLVAADLDTTALQNLYLEQELDDNQKRAIFVDDATGLMTAGSQRITFVADPSSAQDAATKNYVDTRSFATAQIADGAITTAKIAASAVTTAKIADGNVTTAKILDDNVTTSKILAANITTGKLATDAVTTVKITDSNITTAKIADANVTTAKILDSNVTTAKIADSNVTTAKIANLNVTTAKIAAAAVTVAELGVAAVETAKIADSAVTTAKIADANVTTVKILDSNVTTAKIADSHVTTAKILDANVTTIKIADSNVTTAKIADANVTTAKILDVNVTTAKIADSNVTTAKIADSNVTTAKINDLNVTTGKLAADAVTTAKITDLNVTTAKLAADAVTNAKLADDAVELANVKDGELTIAKLNPAAVVVQSEVSGYTGLDTSVFTTLASDSRYFRQDSTETILSTDVWSGSDSFIASTGAIDARIVDLVDDVGGFVPIANETSFPAANPDVNDGAGTIVSIKEIATTRTPSSGTVTIANGQGANTVTITGCSTTVLTAGFGVLIETTATLNTYSFHRLVPKATEVTTVAGISADVTTVATNIADIQTVASDLNEAVSEINTVATDITNVNTVGGAIANVNTVAGAIANVNSVASNSANINTVSGAIANVNLVGASIADVNSVATNLASVSNFADVYRIAASDPTTSLNTGDLVFNSTSNELRVYNGSAWQGGVTATGNLMSKTGDTFTGPAGVTLGTALLPGLFFSGDPNTGVFSPGANQFSITTDGVSRLAVGATGDVALSAALSVTTTLAVTGASTLTGALAANGGITVDSTAFTVADTTGNTSIGGTLGVTGISTFTGALNANGGVVGAVTGAASSNVLKAGDTMTGALVMGNNQAIDFKEATANGSNKVSVVTAASLTSDTTLTLPNITGTVVTTGDTGTVTSTMITDGTILNADINASAAIVYSKLSLGTSIVNADISASAAIVDTKLATISTASKVSNSATTATDANTNSAIVARDASGNFTAGTITAALTGLASSATTAAACTGNAATVTTNANLTGDVTSSGNATSIAAGVIVNADVSAAAAIAGTKVTGDFGAQNMTTTGTTTAAKFHPGSNGTAALPVIGIAADPDTGMFFGTNEVNLTRNGIVGMTLNTTETKFTLQDTNKFTVATTGNANVLAVSPGIARLGIREEFPCGCLDIKVGEPGSTFDFGASWGAATTAILIHTASPTSTASQNMGALGITYNNTKGAIFGAIEPGVAWKDFTFQHESVLFEQAGTNAVMKLTAGNYHIVGSVTISSVHALINVGSNTVKGAAALNVMCGAGQAATRDANVFNIHWDGSAAYLYIDTSQIGSFAYASDYRIKKDVVNLENFATEKIKALRPVRYTHKDYEVFKASEKPFVGFLAHEVQEVLPEGASGEKDGEDIQHLKLDAILAYTVKALQEAVARIETLEAQVAILSSAK